MVRSDQQPVGDTLQPSLILKRLIKIKKANEVFQICVPLFILLTLYHLRGVVSCAMQGSRQQSPSKNSSWRLQTFQVLTRLKVTSHFGQRWHVAFCLFCPQGCLMYLRQSDPNKIWISCQKKLSVKSKHDSLRLRVAPCC